ncbi:MAG: trypsin-like peptidase domain-containing protein [Planctomycetota bacterium]
MRFLNTNDSQGERRENRDSNHQTSDQQDCLLLDAYSRSVIDVVQRVSPSVIHINRQSEQGSGSGFLVSSDGYAITNHHVSGTNSALLARTVDGDRIDAQVIGSDAANDVALVKLAASELPYVEFGDSSGLQVGQLVVAIGSPLGLQSTVSSGIVSALQRSMRSEQGNLMEDIVQHSAPINPGNSGGPLVDSNGQVIGINTAIIAMAQGICFAISSNTAKWVMEELLEHGEVRRRQLGVLATTIRLHMEDIRRFDLITDSAVEVVDVVADSFADTIGLKTGDKIVAINGRLITGVDDLHRLMKLMDANSELQIEIVRPTVGKVELG